MSKKINARNLHIASVVESGVKTSADVVDNSAINATDGINPKLVQVGTNALNIGNLDSLTTNDKSNIVNAINELRSDLENVLVSADDIHTIYYGQPIPIDVFNLTGTSYLPIPRGIVPTSFSVEPSSSTQIYKFRTDDVLATGSIFGFISNTDNPNIRLEIDITNDKESFKANEIAQYENNRAT